MTVSQYLDNLNQRYSLGNATEHTFRGDLQQLLESIVPDIRATNEPKRQSCGAPDYILTKKEVPVGFIEAKDIGDKDLEGKKKTGNKEQFDRYKASLNNLIFTDYIDFHLYRDGEFVTKIAIASPNHSEGGGLRIVPLPENFVAFENLIKEFVVHIGQTIKNPKKLAEMMAGKARLLSDVIGKALTSDEDHQEDSTLKDQMHAFKDILIHDITPKGFADVYAQTIAYGMFAARLHDPTLKTFSRQEAAELIPKSNPFLRKLFGYIAGPDIDDRIKWIVDNLTEIFLACNVEDILKNYGKATKMEDPIIHFYETFLSEYDPKLRKARGVWYTPAPVVNFIVRAVDDILKTEFGLPQGLADTSKTTVKINTQIADKNFSSGYKQYDQEVHKVQILDPATGTGTFLAEVIKHVHKKFKGQEGIWSAYVENQLLPRLNGFELLMASYAMAHLQIDLLLKETGYLPVIASAAPQPRTRIYLTNSLEEYHPDTGTLFANWLSTEANEANQIKRDTPVMCVIGNPPYSISSTNKGEWIQNLILDYKKDLIEKSYNSLSDDYVKFIRYGQYFVEKNGEGVLAYISNNSFIDGLIHRQMRKNLLETFDSIYILNLHGDAKKKEVCIDGKPDQNVFDIMQGVSINIFVKVKNGGKKGLANVYYFDLQGKRNFKYDFLNEFSIKKIGWEILECKEPNYFFTNKNFTGQDIYEKGFKIDDLFKIYNNGIETGKDAFFYSLNSKELKEKLEINFNNKPDSIIKYGINNTSSFKFKEKFYSSILDFNKIRFISYRPFDILPAYYDENLQRRPAFSTMKYMFLENIGLLVPRQFTGDFKFVFISKYPTDGNLTGTAKKFGSAPLFPLYLYPETTTQQTLESQPERVPNFNMAIIKEFEEKTGLYFRGEDTDPEATVETNTFSPEELLHYIYAVLHSPTYREKYKEFLKIDFPRVPFPKDPHTFYALEDLGRQLKDIHLLESPTVEDYITTYPVGGSNTVTKPHFTPALASNPSLPTQPSLRGGTTKQSHESTASTPTLGKVYINETQYFDNMPLVAWEFYIGGYQPAQKWLKDRKQRTLGYDDILHYQKIIVALYETDRLMKEIDGVEIE